MIIAVLGCSVMSNSLRPWTIAHQLPLSMGLSRQGYWSGLPFPTSGDFPDPGIEPASPVSPALQTDSLPGNYDLRFYSDFEFPRDFTHIMISFAPSSGLPW